MKGIDLNLLTSLGALLRHRSVTNAATELGLTQSAMSYNLRRLRETFHDDLFTRTSNGLVMTPFARTLHEPLSRILVETETLVSRDKGFDPGTASRTFKIALPDASEVILMPEILRRIGKEAPGIQLELAPTARSEILRELDEGAVDLAIGTFSEGQVHHKRRLVHTDEYLCICNRSLFPSDRPLSLDEFLAASHVVFADPSGRPDVVGEALAKEDRSRKVLVSTPHLLSIPFIVLDTASVAVVHGVLAHHFARLLHLSVTRPPVDLPSVPISLLWHSSHDIDPGHKWLRKLVTSAVTAARQAMPSAEMAT